jgi:hypothetical protein
VLNFGGLRQHQPVKSATMKKPFPLAAIALFALSNPARAKLFWEQFPAQRTAFAL